MNNSVYFLQADNNMIALTDGLSEEQCRKIQPQLKRLAAYDNAKEQIQERINNLKNIPDACKHGQYSLNTKEQTVKDLEWVLSCMDQIVQ